MIPVLFTPSRDHVTEEGSKDKDPGLARPTNKACEGPGKQGYSPVFSQLGGSVGPETGAPPSSREQPHGKLQNSPVSVSR
jgi:hypothetical protein